MKDIFYNPVYNTFRWRIYFYWYHLVFIVKLAFIEGVWGNALNCVCTSSHVDEPARTSTLLFLLNNGADYNLKVILEFEEDEISFKEMVNSASYSDKEDIIETFNRFLNSKSQ
jgi:hypothetical protein